MHVIVVFLLSWSLLLVQCTSSHFSSFEQQLQRKKACEGPSNTSLVENFFNLIFSEFHSNPPVCVCVQMCPNHPTYCYPNGCFNKADSNKNIKDSTTTQYQRIAQVSQLQQDASKPMSFLADGQTSFLDNFMGFKGLDSRKATKFEDPSNQYKEMHRDPFKDRYQSIFKYRKTPKVHLKYNLREKVKHKKSDILKIEKIDIAKTRWPTGSDKKSYEKSNKNNDQYFHSEAVETHFPSKFFKRDVTKLFNKKDNNIGKVYDNGTDNMLFSLENLIENLIETSFGPLTNDTELNLNVNLGYSVVSNSTDSEPLTASNKRDTFDENDLLTQNTWAVLNETTNVLSINNTSENKDVNMYHEDDENNLIYKNVIEDMIASLTRNIERNNNSSIEIMEQALKEQIEQSTNSEIITKSPEISVDEGQSDVTCVTEAVTEAILNNTIEELITTTSTTTTETSAVATQTIEIMSTEMEKENINLMRKSHRRILRKLHVNKPN